MVALHLTSTPMPSTIFFSWQVDRSSREGRNFIERALQQAAGRIGEDATVEKAVRELKVDRDTKGVPGFPPIVDTIFRKIDKATVFVPDLTFVGTRADGRPTPNPNVLVEYGWALKSLTYARIIPVMNVAFGDPAAESMPFDMQHLRNPIAYNCRDDLSEDARRKVRARLAAELEGALRAVLDSDEFRSSLPKLPPPPGFRAKQPADGFGRFRPRNEPLGIVQRGIYEGGKEIQLSQHPAIWFRIMPTSDPGRTWSVADLETALKQRVLPPLSRDWSGYGFLRGADGYGIYAVLDEQLSARAVVYAFTTGELWSIDTYWLDAMTHENRKAVPSVEQDFRNTLKDYAGFLENLGIKPPYKWIAGMEDLKGRDLFVPAPPGHMRYSDRPQGRGLVSVVEESGLYSPGESLATALKPFFVKLYDSCGVARREWQDA
jgi:hypothetical protein